MPGLVQESTFKTITVKELHPTFGAEIEGVNFPNPSEEQFKEVLAAMAKYGVCVFRNTGMDDTAHVEFSRRLGDLDDIRPYMTGGRKMRYQHYELFDAGNVDENGNVIDPSSPKAQYQKGNGLFHVDSSFNPRRASFSLLRAYELPPPGHGGNTDFADSRTAFDELPEELKSELLEYDYAAAHCMAHSRKTAAPEFFKDLDVESQPMYAHKIAQLHEPSNRMNLYIAAHAHHVEGVDKEKSDALLKQLLDHATQEKYRISVPWENPSDLVIWDNTCVLHRAGGGTFAGKFRRDLRRTTVHDASSTAWGLNEKGKDARPGFNLGSSNMKG
ncbi:alpha-ketoglutarate-dependent 2,4-dichlorophenoxyacetate dioxygenase [Lindgomyces ingoldianus]|uniref:Alpha-ketoglutarate-dependent 2,4-dichlorophenoxyacetate dioxygenase n=1 Tax=Lindgomyces ingoldianus TaxID=673940 RepID=A0ACB6QFB4_9PLEO|nr:alpha-ketoglutarate-dependent 2,4-dichlorophenoxyacetate dioxygenase [Lindgomyces ingoldianus]KAF2465679.1 alpha-ketoglutarate-dependent 2,4-dichlorophenoxyacetate dioxygenase [Lindgomyces ingoldianus]